MENLVDYKNLNTPLLSVVIPTYEEHHKYLQEAIDSIKFDAEVIIVNDSLTELVTDSNHLTIINRDTEERWGTGKARNIGARYASTELLIWLDSDDVFLPNGVEVLYNNWLDTVSDEHPYGQIIYGGFVRGFDNIYWSMKEQYCGNDIRESGLLKPAMPYCILIPKAMHELIGGYDEEMVTWEDVDYEKKITVAGLCCKWLKNTVIFWYRWSRDGRRAISNDEEVRRATSRHMYQKYRKYHEGVEKLGNCYTCGNPPPSPFKNNVVSKTGSLPSSIASNETLYLVYKGVDPVHTMEGAATGIKYRWGRSSRDGHVRKAVVDKVKDLTLNEVNRADAEEFIQIMRLGNTYDFKYEVEVAVPSAPIPLKKKNPNKIEPETIKGGLENPDLGFIFEQGKPITEFSISDMESHLSEKEVFKSELQTWLEQEERQDKPRKGMLKVLNEALANI